MDNVYRQARDDEQTPPETSDLPPVPEASDAQVMSPEALKKFYASSETNGNFLKRPIGLFGSIVVVLAIVGYSLLEVGMIPPIRDWHRPDHSQTLEEAYAAGAPRVDQAWDLTDCQAFIAYVDSIEPDSYPCYASEKSGELFRKFIHSSLRLAEDGTPRNGRPGPANDIMMVAVELLMTYARANDAGEANYALELSHLLSLQLAASESVISGGTFDHLDPDDPSQAPHLSAARSGVAMMLEGILECLKEPSLGPEESRVITASLLDHGLPMFRFLGPSKQEKVITIAESTWKSLPHRSSARKSMGQFISQIKQIHAASAEQ
jgi:hypothetical protein